MEMGAADAPLWPLPGTTFFTTDRAVAERCASAAAKAWSGQVTDCTAPDCETLEADQHLSPTLQDFERSGMALGRAIAVDGLRLEVTPWGPPTLTVDAHASRPVTETVTLFAQLVDPATGRVWSQADRAVSAGRWSDPQGVSRRLPLWTFRGQPPNALDLVVGAYRNTPEGPQRVGLLAAGAVDAGRLAAAPAARPGAVPFGHAMQLVDSRVRRLGRDVTVDLTWLAEDGAAASDYTVSVQARGDGWSAQHDGTPAQGMIPTLKWLPGMVIHDRHRLRLPDDAPADAPFDLQVGVYDAFSLEPLGVTDGDLVAAGQGEAVLIPQQ
jgi:hypothetical protein